MMRAIKIQGILKS